MIALILGLGACSTYKYAVELEQDYPRMGEDYKYEFNSAAARELAATIKDSVTVSKDGVYKISEVMDAYLKFDRVKATRSDLVELKFRLEHWAYVLKSRLLEAINATSAIDETLQLLNTYQQLQIFSSQSQLIAMGMHFKELTQGWTLGPDLKNAYIMLILKQGDFQLTRNVMKEVSLQDEIEMVQKSHRDGPQIDLKIKASRKSKWPYERWSGLDEMSDYYREDGKVVYKGLTLQSGDILLINQHNKSEGVFTFFTEQENVGAHMAVYIDMEQDGKHFPAIYEAHENGLRLVPLHNYFNQRFSSYVEVYRYKKIPDDWGQKLSDMTKVIKKEPHGFNVWGNYEKSETNRYISCATLCTILLERTGQEYPGDNSIVPAMAQTNFIHFGTEIKAILSPSDFTTDPRLSLVGWIDNDFHVKHVASHLMNRQFNNYFNNYHARPRGSFYGVYHWGTKRIVRNSFIIGPLLLASFGYNQHNKPDGPAALLAFVLIAEEGLDKAGEHLEKDVEHLILPYYADKEFSIHEFEQKPEMREALVKEMQKIAGWFKKEVKEKR